MILPNIRMLHAHLLIGMPLPDHGRIQDAKFPAPLNAFRASNVPTLQCEWANG